jgi:hypothetical protein
MHAAQRHNPVFLHGLWRSGSTYVWSKFRQAPGTYCYYEPLHQGLGRLTRKRIGRDSAETMAENRHPDMAPYFAEFEPLLKGRGVKNFKTRMAYRPYVLEAQDQDPALHRYLSNLLHHAQSQEKQAVFGFNRTGLRIGWLAGNFPSANIYIDRNPRSIWRSYQRHKDEGNYTYFTAWLMTIEQNAEHALFRPIAERLRLRKGADLLFKKPKSFYRAVVDATMTPEETYAMVFYIWLLCGEHAHQYADLIIDMDRMPDLDYRRQARENILSACGIDLDFRDALATAADRSEIDFARIEQETIVLVPGSAQNKKK